MVTFLWFSFFNLIGIQNDFLGFVILKVGFHKLLTFETGIKGFLSVDHTVILIDFDNLTNNFLRNIQRSQLLDDV